MDSWLVWMHALKQLGSLTTIRSLVDVERSANVPWRARCADLEVAWEREVR